MICNPLKIDDLVFMEDFQVGLYIIQRGKFSFVNSHLAFLLGYDNPIELVGISLWSIVHPQDWDKVSLKSKRENTTDRKRKNGFRLIKKNGRVLWVKMMGKNTFYHGQPANIGHVEDLSPIKDLEKHLEKYRMIINEVEDVVAEVDLKGNLIFVNASGAKRYGTSINCKNFKGVESYLEKNKLSYQDYLDQETIDQVKSAYRKVLQTGVPNKNIIYEIIRSNGSRIMVEDSVSLIRDQEDNVVGYRTVSRDVGDRILTEKKMNEHRIRLEAIFRSVNDAIITIDPNFRVIEANASTKKICGVDAKQIIGKKFPSCIDCCSNFCADILWETLHEKKNTKEFTVECRHKDRGHQVVTVSGSPLLDSQRHFMGCVLVLRDVTRLKNLENELFYRHQFQNIIGKSKKMQQIYTLLENLSNVETTVLVTGKSGTGKELVARALHYGGQRALKPFVTVNCSALAENLLESELFGHIKGAFTGAIHNKQGRFHVANGGTLMLDEIGDISPLIQLKLLRVIQEKEFEQVGDIKPCKVDVRIIACTNKDLAEKVRNGQFREDLYYRLKVMVINLPSLKERIEDIPLLVNHFCKLFRKQFSKKIIGLSSDAMELLMNYSWPGNIRELKHVIERAFVLCHGNLISPQQLPVEIVNEKKTIKRKRKYNLQQYDKNRDVILTALNKTKWNKSKAARILGISRQTLYRRIEEYQISIEENSIKIFEFD